MNEKSIKQKRTNPLPTSISLASRDPYIFNHLAFTMGREWLQKLEFEIVRLKFLNGLGKLLGGVLNFIYIFF